MPPAALHAAALDIPMPGAGQVRLRVLACGVCRTDLHVVDGELSEPKLPIVPGHEIVGHVACARAEASRAFAAGRPRRRPLARPAPAARAVLHRRARKPVRRAAVHRLPHRRRLRRVRHRRHALLLALPDGYARRRGGAAPVRGPDRLSGTADGRRGRAARAVRLRRGGAHLWRRWPRIRAGRSMPSRGQATTRRRRSPASLGATWAGGSTSRRPAELDAAIIFAPVGRAGASRAAGDRAGRHRGCGGIHMSDIPSFPYALLWGERSLRSVAHLTRADGRELLDLAGRIPLRAEVHRYPLQRAADALDDLRHGRFSGAAVLVP